MSTPGSGDKEANTLLIHDEPSCEHVDKLNVIYEQLENKLLRINRDI